MDRLKTTMYCSHKESVTECMKTLLYMLYLEETRIPHTNNLAT